jgi:aminoglycoside phosphotransferase (APT) family kinase protein
VSLADEVERWSRALRSVDEALAPGWPAVADLLLANRPQAMAPTVVHGDFRLGNLLAVGSAISAVIDWEIWCVGDPRVDLGWFLINADPDTYGRSTPYVGRLPTPTELLVEYGDQRAASVAAINWFRALAYFKSTATWSLIVKHARRRVTADEATEAIAARLPHLLERAGVLLGEG